MTHFEVKKIKSMNVLHFRQCKEQRLENFLPQMRGKANTFWGGVRKPPDALFLNSLNLSLNAENAAEFRVTSHCCA